MRHGNSWDIIEVGYKEGKHHSNTASRIEVTSKHQREDHHWMLDQEMEEKLTAQLVQGQV